MPDRRTFLQQTDHRFRVGRNGRIAESRPRRRSRRRPASSSCATGRTSACSRSTRARTTSRSSTSWRTRASRPSKTTGSWDAPVDVQEKIGATLAKRGMTMGVFVIDGGDNWKTSLTTGKGGVPRQVPRHLPHGRGSGQTRRMRNGRRWCRATSSANCRSGIQTGNVIDILRAGAEILAPRNLTMVLEPLSDNPGPVPAHLGPGVRDLPRGR